MKITRLYVFLSSNSLESLPNFNTNPNSYQLDSEGTEINREVKSCRFLNKTVKEFKDL